MSTRFLIVLFPVFLSAAYAGTGVTVHDSIVLRGSPHMISVTTGGILFPKGGEVVEFFVDDRSIGRNLSGGDGRALKEYTPDKRGLSRITAVSGGQKGRGMLLALDKGEGIVCIDIEGSLPQGVFPMKPGEGAQAAIELISERFPTVYLQTVVPESLLGSWLRKHGFQEAPIIRWDGGDIFGDLTEKGLKVRAVLGSRAVIQSAADYTENLFSVQETEGAETIGEWKGLDKRIR